MRTNEIFKSRMIVILFAVAIISIFGCGGVFAQTEKRLPAGFYPKGSPEYLFLSGTDTTLASSKFFRSSDYEVEGGVYPLVSGKSFVGYFPYQDLYKENFLTFVDPPSVTPYQVKIWLDIPEGESLNAIYSLYTYKSTFPQDNKRVSQYLVDGTPSMQAIQECGTVVPLSTQEDIDKDLDKIYEFSTVYHETGNGIRLIDWDGKTSDGQTVRDCVIFAAHDKDTGKIIGYVGGGAVEGYRIQARPGVEFIAGPTSISAKITLAYDRPVRRIWAILATNLCVTGSEYVTFGVVNQGGPAIAAGMNKKQPGAALAVTELKNPTLDMDGLVKIFEWNDITGLDGKPVIPPDENTDYLMAIDIEGDDGHGNVIPTFTGLNDGYLTGSVGGWIHFPMPWSYTGIQNPAADDKTVIETTADGFIIEPKGSYNGEWMLTSSAGVKLTAGKGSFVSTSGLPQGVYFLTVSNSQGVKETHKVIVR